MNIQSELYQIITESGLTIPEDYKPSEKEGSKIGLFTEEQPHKKKITAHKRPLLVEVYPRKVFDDLFDFSNSIQLFIDASIFEVKDLQSIINLISLSGEALPSIFIYFKDKSVQSNLSLEGIADKALDIQWIEREEGLPFVMQVEADLTINSSAEKIQAAIEWTRMNALANYRETTDLFITKNKGLLKAKQQISNQSQAVAKLKNTGKNIEDLERKIRSKIQKQIQAFQQGMSDKINKSVKPQVSNFWQRLESDIINMPELVEHKGVKKNYFKVEEAFEQSFYHKIGDELTNLSIEDTKSMSDALNMLKNDIGQTLKQHDLHAVNLDYRYVTPQDIQELFRGDFYKNKEFTADQMNRGIYEYFMAIRKYQMLAMMFFSIFGFSVISKYRLYMIPFSLALMGFGGYFVVKSVRKEREEEGAKNYAKAQQHLKQELKRMSSDYSRQWQNFLKTKLREVQDKWSKEVEETFKTMKKGHSKNNEEERSKIQRVQSNLESKDRLMENLVRNLKSWDSKYLKHIQELKRAYKRT